MRDAGHRTPDAGHRTSDGEKSKNNISTPQGGGHNYQECNAQIPCGSKILTKSLYLARLRRSKQICVLPFLAKIRKFKMAAIFGEGKIFGKLQRLHSLDTLWVENFDEITLSGTVKEIEAN